MDDRGDVARADVAAPATTRRPDGRHMHEVTFDQLRRIQNGEQPRGAGETLQPAHRTDASLDVAMIPPVCMTR
jgi:hypothetical protein